MTFPSWYFNGNYKIVGIDDPSADIEKSNEALISMLRNGNMLNGCPHCAAGFTTEGKACKLCRGSGWSSSCPIYDKPTTIKYSDFQTKIKTATSKKK